MTAMRHYWLDDQDAPFRTLLCVVGTYCHPEAGPDAYGATSMAASASWG